MWIQKQVTLRWGELSYNLQRSWSDKWSYVVQDTDRCNVVKQRSSRYTVRSKFKRLHLLTHLVVVSIQI